jgi:hypothetical protein
VIVDVLMPSAVIDVGEAVIVDCAALAEPTVNVTPAVDVIAEPFNVPETVVLPTVVGEVKRAL